MAHRLIGSAAVVWCCACTVPRRPAQLPPAGDAWIAVLSGEMPHPIGQVARHAWIVASVPGRGALGRWELLQDARRSTTGAPFAYFGDGDVAVHGIVRDGPEAVVAAAHCLDEEVDRYNERHPEYVAYPGPNSNTFVAEALRHCSIHVELPATAIGRDYRGWIGAGVTESGTGVQVESVVAGLRFGFREGVEAHIGALALGVHAWPPGLTVPVNPGRVGVDLDGHVRAPKHSRERESSDGEGQPELRFGLAIAQLYASAARTQWPRDANGLAERLVGGLSVRALRPGVLSWGMGADLELGSGIPGSFAYAAALYPAGIAHAIGDTGYVGAFAGVGTSGATGQVPGALEIPAELRLELDAGREARFGLRGAMHWMASQRTSRGEHDLVLGTFVRIGRTVRRDGAVLGSGTFFGLERHETMGTFWLGVRLGVELDCAG